jgi:hypothetical protein
VRWRMPGVFHVPVPLSSYLVRRLDAVVGRIHPLVRPVLADA